MVLHKFGDRLYDGLVATINQHLQEVARRIDSTQNEQFLQEINQRWNDHNKSMQMIRDILMVQMRVILVYQLSPSATWAVHNNGIGLAGDGYPAFRMCMLGLALSAAPVSSICQLF